MHMLCFFHANNTSNPSSKIWRLVAECSRNPEIKAGPGFPFLQIFLRVWQHDAFKFVPMSSVGRCADFFFGLIHDVLFSVKFALSLVEYSFERCHFNYVVIYANLGNNSHIAARPTPLLSF
jgi:hypothetical protein